MVVGNLYLHVTQGSWHLHYDQLYRRLGSHNLWSESWSLCVSRVYCSNYIPPPGEIPLPPESVIEKGDCVSKRFVFDPPKLAALKAMVCDKMQNLTIVEIVTAFTHRCDISALKSNSGSLLNPSTLLIQTVNLRARFPPSPKSSVGCMVWYYAVSTAEDESVI